MTASPVSKETDFVVYEVSAREYRKMVFLLDAIRQMDRMYQNFKKWRETVAFSDGVTVDPRIDWLSVVRYCAPDVLVVLAHDKEGTSFEDFPLYAVLPDSQQFIQLDRTMNVSVQVSEDGKPELDVQSTLNSLLTYVESMDSGKKENAMKQLRILIRLLK
jgi:hypothetical protein